MAVLVLGGYGLIGSAIVEDLLARGASVRALGRDTHSAAARWPGVQWISTDLADLATPESWRVLLDGVDVVVNAAGVLQRGLKDDVVATQDRAMLALYTAARTAGVRRIVQISAVGAEANSPLEFLNSKARADAALQASGLDHAILRPGLVISPAAYGGTALLRGLSAMPAVSPLVHGQSPVQAVWIGDVVEAVGSAIEGRVASGVVADLVERPVRSLAQTIGLMRRWLGLRPVPLLALPNGLGDVVALGADGLGWLGWRSPLRSTAMAVMTAGVQGDAEAGERLLGRPLKTLPQMLALVPAGPQERWFARLWLLKPLIIGGLSAFWLASGIIGLFHWPAASAILTDRGVSLNLAEPAAIGGGIIDVALGAAVIVRPWCRRALTGMLLTSAAYAVCASLFTPDIWLDPLGPLVKIFPAMLLVLVALAILDER